MKDGRYQLKDIPDRLVVRFAADWSAEKAGPGVVDQLVALGFPEKLAVRKVEQLCTQRYCVNKLAPRSFMARATAGLDGAFLEYGTSPRYAWPTAAGEAWLEHVAEQDDYIEQLKAEASRAIAALEEQRLLASLMRRVLTTSQFHAGVELRDGDLVLDARLQLTPEEAELVGRLVPAFEPPAAGEPLLGDKVSRDVFQSFAQESVVARLLGKPTSTD